VEDPPAVVIEQHDREREPVATRGEQTADVVRERNVSDQQHHRACAGRARPERRGHRAVDSVRPAVREHPRTILSCGQE
jgi:hypothetical protein